MTGVGASLGNWALPNPGGVSEGTQVRTQTSLALPPSLAGPPSGLWGEGNGVQEGRQWTGGRKLEPIVPCARSLLGENSKSPQAASPSGGEPELAISPLAITCQQRHLPPAGLTQGWIAKPETLHVTLPPSAVPLRQPAPTAFRGPEVEAGFPAGVGPGGS